MSRVPAEEPQRERPVRALLRSGLQGIGAVTLGVAILAAVAALVAVLVSTAY